MWRLSYLGSLVFGGGEEVGTVGGHLHVSELQILLVNLLRVDELSGLVSALATASAGSSSRVAHLSVVLAHGTILVAGDDVLVQVTPCSNSRLALLESDGEQRSLRLRSVDVNDNWEHRDGSEETHSHLSDGQQERAIL